jgi:hypothetical protein
MSFDYVKPFDGEYNVERKELAKYLNRVGRGVNCRMDVPILVISDIKWAAKVFSDLAKTLTDLGWEDDRSDIWRILAARHAMESARSELTQKNQQKTSIKLAKSAKDSRRA